jgi:hypothetical protein
MDFPESGTQTEDHSLSRAAISSHHGSNLTVDEPLIFSPGLAFKI